MSVQHFLAEGAEHGVYDIHVEWGTFIAQLFAFAVIVAIIGKYVAPLVRGAAAKQQQTVARQLEESATAQARLAEAKQAYEHAAAEADREGAKIREDARADAEAIASELRAQATAEVGRIEQHGREQVVLARQQLIRQLTTDLGTVAVGQAGQRVREHLAAPQAKADSIDRFLDELEAMAASGAAPTRKGF